MGTRKTAKRKVKNNPDNDLLLHASVAGSLMIDKKGAVITPIQLAELEAFLFREEQAKLDPKKRLTAKMTEKKEYLIAKRDKPFELSDTAKTMLEQVWRQNVKNIPNLVTSKYMEKGLWVEEEAITLLTEVDGRFYVKNKERKFDDMFTGECDINSVIPDVGKVIQDVKANWDSVTFMGAKLTPLWEWQGRVYMELYDADEFWLRCCLMDAPSHILEGEKFRFASRHGIIDQETPEAEALIDAFERTMMFSNNPTITPRERVKTFKIKRDKELFKEIRKRVPVAREYYRTIQLNQTREDYGEAAY